MIQIRPLLLMTAATSGLLATPLRAQETAADPAVAPPPVATPVNGKGVFAPEDFARFAPRNALDMLRQVPGFVIREAELERGLGQASENVLLNGQRVPSKSGGALAELQKIPAAHVERIEIVDAATLDIAGLSGQVANVIAKTKKSGGQFSWTPEFRAHFTDPIFTRGDISYTGSNGRLDYTIGLDSRGSRSGAGGPTTIFDANRVPTEFRGDVWHTHNDSPKASGRFTWNGAEDSIANLNLSYNPYWFDYWEESERERPDGHDQRRDVHQENDGYIYEFGADYVFGLGPGKLKLIGLRKVESEPVTTTAITQFANGAASEGDLVDRDGRYGEWIGRAEYGWKSGRSDWQISVEAAFNKLNSVTRIYELDETGEFDEIDYPEGTGSVREDRYEGLLTYGRPLSSKLTVQAVAGGEYSRLASETSLAGLERSFFRPKGSLSFAWQANPNTDVSLKFRRRVWQLNFYDFLASSNLIDGSANAGNIDLVPPQSWEVEAEANRKLGKWGTTQLRLFGKLIDDIVDVVPIGEDGESPGNIDRATQFGGEWKSTFLFDPIGWKGAKLDLRILLQRSRLKDPLTGNRRPISGDVLREIEINLRHDIAGTPWAWGANLYHDHYALSYRLTEFGRVYEGPLWLNVFVEHKDVFGLTVRARAGNLLNARSTWDRTVYDGRRHDPVSFYEDRDRLIGPIFDLSVRGNF